MKNVIVKLCVGLLMFGLIGCVSSGSASMPKADTTKQFRFDAVNFKFEQLVTPDITYHTAKELEKLLNDKITFLLQEKGLLSDQESMNKLNITAFYQRRFAGDGTPFPSDSLSPPRYAYTIEVLDSSGILRKVERKDLIFKGGMAMNFQFIAGTLRDKKYEIDFVDALANGIVEQIENL